MYTARDLDLDGLVGFGSVFVKSQVALLRLLGRTRTQWVQTTYSVIHNSIAPSKELCSKMALEEVGVSLP